MPDGGSSVQMLPSLQDPDSRTAPRKRPSSLWALFLAMLLAANVSMTLSLRPQLLIDLACVAHPPSDNGNSTAHVVQYAKGSGARLTTDLAANTSSTNQQSELEHQQGNPFFSSPITVFVAATQTYSTRGGGPIGGYSSSTLPSIGRYAGATTPAEDESERCRRDVGVQKLSARIHMGFRIIGGVCTIAMTGFWASLSDRLGRMRVLAISIFGLALNDACFLFVAACPQLMTGATGFVVLFSGPLLGGLLGDLPAFSAVISAFITDTTPESRLSTRFAMLNAVSLIGGVCGTLGSLLLIRLTGDLLTPLRAGICGNVLLTLALLFLFPESLSLEDRQRHIKSAEIERAAAAERDAALVVSDGDSFASSARSLLGRLLTPVESLRILMPQPRDPDNPSLGRNWNMTFLAVAIFAISMTTGITQPKDQYAMYVFGWDYATLGPLGIFQAVFRFLVLVVLTPLITRYFKPYFIRRAARANDQISTLPSEETPLLIPPDQIEAVATGADTSDTGPQHVAPVYFDYVLLCFCLLAEVVGYTVLGSNAKGSAAIYIVTSAWLHLGAPASACAISMAVALGPGDHTSSGRLFGALGILDGLSSIFISPLLFTSVFSATLAFYPPATFLVAAACWLLGLLAVRCIKLPRTSRDSASA